jgi:hypothetical protein
VFEDEPSESSSSPPSSDDDELEIISDNSHKKRAKQPEFITVTPLPAPGEIEKEPITIPLVRKRSKKFETIDELIEHNKHRHDDALRKKAHTIQLTGQIPTLREKQRLDKYYQDKILTGREDKPDYDEFEMLRENASSGVNSVQTVTNLVIQNEV